MMEKIASFTIDHDRLIPGLYVSRIDGRGDNIVTTFDIRMKKPNDGDYLSTTAAHTIEHLGATFLRSNPQTRDLTVYFGPMGCRTGFYAVFFGKLAVSDVKEWIVQMFEFIVNFQGDVPGASSKECGNFRDLELSQAKREAEEFLPVLKNLNEANTIYPN